MRDFSMFHGGRGRHFQADPAGAGDTGRGRRGDGRGRAWRAAVGDDAGDRPGRGRHHGGPRGDHGGPFGSRFGGGGGRFGGDPFDDGFAGPAGGPRQRRGKRFDGEALRLMVLSLLAEAPQHGYQLIRSFAARSNDAYQPSPGVLYPLLAMLTDQGLLAEAEAAGQPQGQAGGRRSFAVTAAGEAELAVHAELVTALFARLAALGEGAAPADIAPVRRALHGLRAAVIDRIGHAARAAAATGSDAAAAADPVRGTVLEIARLIDEITQTIERL